MVMQAIQQEIHRLLQNEYSRAVLQKVEDDATSLIGSQEVWSLRAPSFDGADLILSLLRSS